MLAGHADHTERLLGSLFTSTTDVQVFVKTRLQHGHDLCLKLPGAGSSLQHYLHHLVEQLSMHGELNGPCFFSRLQLAYPGRIKDIRVVTNQVERLALGRWLARDLDSKFADGHLKTFTAVLAITKHALLERCLHAGPTESVREVFQDRWPTREELSEWTTEKLRDLNFVADGAELLAMPLVAFEAGLDDEDGTVLLRQVFPDKFPVTPKAAPSTSVPTPAPNTVTSSPLDRDLGSLTAKEARLRGLATTIAYIVDVPVNQVEKTLASVHGRNYIRNLFWNHWPEDDRFGDFSIAEVHRHHLVGTIAAILGLSATQVQDHLKALGSGPDVLATPLRTAFRDKWPVFESDPEIQDAEMPELDYESLSVGDAVGSRNRDDIFAAIAYLTDTTRAKRVAEALAVAPPTFRVKDVFAERWPTSERWLQFSVSAARRYALAPTLAKRFGVPVDVLRERLREEHGNTLLSRISQARTQGSTSKVSLGELTLAEVDRRGLRTRLTKFLDKQGVLQQRGVTRRFNQYQGNARVRNVFNEIDHSAWPEV